MLRARMYEPARAKAERGELRISVPFGYVWQRDYDLGFDPDIRLQETMRLIFARFREIGSACQVLISMTDDGMHFPRPSDRKKIVSFDWVPIRYRNVISTLKNPFYAETYVYDKSEKRTEIVDGRSARAMVITNRPASGRWCSRTITRAIGLYRMERVRTEPGAARRQRLWQGGWGQVGPRRACLAPGTFLLCPCGRRLVVIYAGRGQGYPVYRCDRGNQMMAKARCMSFNAERRYAAACATPRTASLRPSSRRKSWEVTLRRVESCEARLSEVQRVEPIDAVPDFTGLAQDLEAAGMHQVSICDAVRNSCARSSRTLWRTSMTTRAM